MTVPGKHCLNRRMEWYLSAAQLLIGLLMSYQPDSLATSMFRLAVEVIESASLCLTMTLLGIARMSALWLNGHVPFYGPIARSAGAVAGAMVWTLLASSLWQLVETRDGTIPLLLPLFVVLAISELDSAYRAAADARRHPAPR